MATIRIYLGPRAEYHIRTRKPACGEAELRDSIERARRSNRLDLFEILDGELRIAYPTVAP